ncbi:MAG: DUF2203 domain-containing protein [Deinococcus sp.]|nr:DUF2203 domain-containing protein [Deinococcus sp.]
MRTFTLVEARALLPQVKAVARELEHQVDELRQVVADLERMGVNTSRSALDKYNKQVEKEFLESAVRQLAEHLESLGCRLKGIEPILVDFPAVYKGQAILLCWRAGEEQINFWHDRHTGFAGRRPVEELLDDEAIIGYKPMA